MKLHYYPDTDSLYIDLSSSPGVRSIEVSEDVVADFGEDGKVVGFDIQHASQHLDLASVETQSLPLTA